MLIFKFSCTPIGRDGGYTEWSDFSACSETCGKIGTKIRRRNCTNPVPGGYGQNCSFLGPDQEVTACNNGPCPGRTHLLIEAHLFLGCHPV